MVERKGSGVVTAASAATVRRLVSMMVERGIGAVVVSEDGAGVDGIVSERDVVRRLHTEGASVLDASAGSIMTRSVLTCGLDTELEEVARTMTEYRIRHMPILDDQGRLTGIVSIGDVVKQRIDQLQAERDQLMAYISQ